MFSIDPVKTGQNLKKYRKRKGLDVKEVAVMLELQAPQSVYKWERGDCLPCMDNFLALCYLYDVSPIDLLGFYDKDQEECFINFFNRITGGVNETNII